MAAAALPGAGAGGTQPDLRTPLVDSHVAEPSSVVMAEVRCIVRPLGYGFLGGGHLLLRGGGELAVVSLAQLDTVHLLLHPVVEVAHAQVIVSE